MATSNTDSRRDIAVAESAVSSSAVSSDHQGSRINNKRRRPKKRRVAEVLPDKRVWPWTTSLGMTEYESKQQRLHDEIVAYVSYIAPTSQEQRAREQVVARVRDLITRRFSGATVTMFGSMASNLCLPDGDVDLVMTLPRELDQDAKKKTLFQLSAVFKNSLMTRSVQVVYRARVPVISFETVPELGSFKIDISINSVDGVKAVPIIAGYLDRMPALRYLVLVAKGYLSSLKLNSASEGGLSSYSVICLVISFLQLNPRSALVEDIQKPLERESLGRLWLDFLQYYGSEYDYTNSCISISRGGLVTKESKGWEMSSQPDHLAIECLVNSDHDIGRPTGRMKQVRIAFQNAHMILQGYPFTMAHTNVLGTIIGISLETVSRREHLRTLVDSGSLERALKEIKLPPAYFAPRRQNAAPNRAQVPRGSWFPSHQEVYNPIDPYFSGGAFVANPYRNSYPHHTTFVPTDIVLPTYGRGNPYGHGYAASASRDYGEERRPKRQRS